MRHTSIPLLEHPCEFINITPVNPLISKCEIKVCYVGDTPNRNKSVITKDVAREMANSLPGSPIVGYYNETAGDFEEHNRVIEFSGGGIQLKDTTRPYGFVDLGAKVWFQKFLDDGKDEREYLMTEGYLWTEQYPEAQRIIDQGNNQSMELSDKFLDGTWTKDNNGKPKFFIINEAIISKLCILGEEMEPCFEGATITQPTIQFSFDEGFKEQLFSMMNELKELIKEGGTPMFSMYAVEIGCALWDALYGFIENTFPAGDECHCSKFYIDSVWEEGTQKFAILKDRENSKLYRLDFAYTEDGITSTGELTEVEATYVPVVEDTPVYNAEAVAAYEAERYGLQGNSVQNVENETEVEVEEPTTEFAKKEDEEDDDEEEVCPECGKPIDECECEKKKKEFSLEEAPEYIELQERYSALETEFNALTEVYAQAQSEIETLTQFKADVERKDKQAMIDSFYMLSDEDKQDVVDNINTYSLDDIEAKLAVICVRNKVNFNLDDDNNDNEPTTYSLNGGGEADLTPAWVKSLQSVAKDIK